MRATLTGAVWLLVAAIGGFGLWWAIEAGWLKDIPFLPSRQETSATSSATADGRRVLYYRNPMGEPDTSPVPKKDSMGMDYIPVYADEAPRASKKPDQAPPATAGRRILYYRNPMGLADTSPVPKKDSMGMDYVPVYADETDAPGVLRLSVDKVQRLGVRTAPATRQVLNESVLLSGTVTPDERKLAVVALKFRGNIVRLHVAATGEKVRKGQKLFDIQSPFILKEELDLALALRMRDVAQASGGVYARTNERSIKTTRQRLRLFEVPEAEIDRLIRTQEATGSITWPAPQDGTVIEKPIVAGMQAEEGTTLYRLADLSNIWVIAEAPEQALSIARPGAAARITLNAYPGRTFEGTVTFVYPEVSMTTRTAKLRIELANKDNLLIPGMFASVEVSSPAGDPVLAVPDGALIDSGRRQIVLVARGEGLFEPRAVTAGRRANGMTEIISGLAEGEAVVSSATFLIDAESNLRAALQSFTAGDGAQPKETAQ